MIKKVHTNMAPEAIGPYSQAVIVNDFVFTSGQIALNPETNEMEGTTIEEQAERVMKNLEAILTKAGSSLEKVVKTTCYLTDMEDFAAFNQVYAKYFITKPARSCVAVKQLPKNALLEVEVIAIL
ncbi:MAG: RidA family protein [Firmicutes bacterium]|nr:RidA family protein [Bacillota bacterium]